jgi:hypothetical protein
MPLLNDSPGFIHACRDVLLSAADHGASVNLCCGIAEGAFEDQIEEPLFSLLSPLVESGLVVPATNVSTDRCVWPEIGGALLNRLRFECARFEKRGMGEAWFILQATEAGRSWVDQYWNLMQSLESSICANAKPLT